MQTDRTTAQRPRVVIVGGGFAGLSAAIVVAMNWLWNYLTFQRGTRLITGADPEPAPAPPGAASERPPVRDAA